MRSFWRERVGCAETPSKLLRFTFKTLPKCEVAQHRPVNCWLAYAITTLHLSTLLHAHLLARLLILRLQNLTYFFMHTRFAIALSRHRHVAFFFPLLFSLHTFCCSQLFLFCYTSVGEAPIALLVFVLRLPLIKEKNCSRLRVELRATVARMKLRATHRCWCFLKIDEKERSMNMSYLRDVLWYKRTEWFLTRCVATWWLTTPTLITKQKKRVGNAEEVWGNKVNWNTSTRHFTILSHNGKVRFAFVWPWNSQWSERERRWQLVCRTLGARVIF